MSSFIGFRQLAVAALLVLVLIAITGHVFVEVADGVYGDNPQGANLTLAPGCLHTSVLLPVIAALALGLVPHFVPAMIQPILHGYCAPTPQRPPVSAPSH